MVFTPSTLFKDIACPAGETCALVNCIFSHELRPQKLKVDASHASNSKRIDETFKQHAVSDVEPTAKRRKVVYETLDDKPLSRAEMIRKDLAKAKSENTTSKGPPVTNTAESSQPQKESGIDRPISPPSTKATARHANDGPDKQTAETTALSKLLSGKAESLNPRMVTPAPDSHSKRTLFVQYIHADMARLNRSIKTSSTVIDGIEPTRLKEYALSDQALIKLALTEEEDIARKTPLVYSNIIRNRIIAYKRMTVLDWLKKLRASIFVDLAKPDSKPASSQLSTAIAEYEKSMPEDRNNYFNSLKIKDQNALSDHGYIANPPSAAQAIEAQAGVIASSWHELCDRCGSRFRIYPDRDPETGRLTSNGPCHYHWARKSYPTKQNTDAYTGGKAAFYRCCGQEAGTPGCTTHTDHVFKCSAPARLAAVLPFITTPSNTDRKKSPRGDDVDAVCFDCEMGYTTNGLELIRLTALRWPNKEPLVDVLVRPLGAVIDLNTRFSGVKPEHFTTAIPYNRDNPSTTLQVVPDPSTARSLLCEYLDGNNIPLMGHAIDNDLNTVRLCHPFVIDTVMLYPHPRGLPLRYGLKMLTKKHLNRDIQMGGSEGHDSFEDAAATMDLVILKGLHLINERLKQDPLPLKRPLSPQNDEVDSSQPPSLLLSKDDDQLSSTKRARAIC